MIIDDNVHDDDDDKYICEEENEDGEKLIEGNIYGCVVVAAPEL
jgi:hypothetical protein